MDLADIQRTGTIIAGTLSGPDTYYEYRGQEFGVQYQLAQEFARSIGVKLRMETAPDTATLLMRLYSGEIDFIALEMPRWETRTTSPFLCEAIYLWWKPKRIQKMIEAMRQQHVTRRQARPFMLDRAHGTISQFDELFIRYSGAAQVDWRLLAAVCYQESAFDPNARSWAGAQGLMQIMPATAQHLGIAGGDVYDPETNISAGARYLGSLQRTFSDIPDSHQRICFALAAYNGGAHHVRDAMALTQLNGGNPHLWRDVSTYILRLSEPHYYLNPIVKHGYMRGSETEAYVRQIIDRWQQYCGMAHGASSSYKPAPAKSHTQNGVHVSQVKTAEEWDASLDDDDDLKQTEEKDMAE